MALHLLKSRGELPAENRSVLALERGLQRTRELVDQTLQIARVASGIELRKQATTLKALFDDVELIAVSEAEAKGVEIHSLIESDQRIVIDTRLVRSAVGNLLRNAVKYTAAGTTIEMRGQDRQWARGHRD